LNAVSIIIISRKQNIVTLDSVKNCPVPYEVIISRKNGLSIARNWGAEQANNDLLLFLDDDLSFKDDLWKEVLSTEKGHFKMIYNVTCLEGFPVTRVLAIHKEDYWRVGGFDDKFIATSEDRDFYARAIVKHLRFTAIPTDLVTHQAHDRKRNIYNAIWATADNVRFIQRYAIIFPKTIFEVDFLRRIKRKQIRTLVMQTVLFYYYLFKWKK
jgi:glycosyltransferase involved in cell wall biosynthesis